MSLVIETMQPETVADEATRKWGMEGMGREEECGMGGSSEHSQILIHSHLYLSYGQAHALPRQASRSTPHIVPCPSCTPPNAPFKHSLYHQAHDEAD